MITLRRSTVPLFLRDGDFFRCLGEDDGEVFAIPMEYYVTTEEGEMAIQDENHLRQLLSTLRFWCVHKAPKVIYDIMFGIRYVDFKHVFAEYKEKLRFLDQLERIQALHPDLHLDAATLNGNLELIKYLMQEKHRVLDIHCIRSAAERGHVHCLEYFNSIGYEWNKEAVCEYAAVHGHLNCLQYAVEQGAVLRNCRAQALAALRNRAEIIGYIEKTMELQQYTTTPEQSA